MVTPSYIHYCHLSHQPVSVGLSSVSTSMDTTLLPPRIVLMFLGRQGLFIYLPCGFPTLRVCGLHIIATQCFQYTIFGFPMCGTCKFYPGKLPFQFKNQFKKRLGITMQKHLNKLNKPDSKV
jgi:hypothetical protein